MILKYHLVFTLLATLTLVLSCKSQVTSTVKKTTEKFSNMPIEILKAKYKLNYDVNNEKTSVVKIGMI